MRRRAIEFRSEIRHLARIGVQAAALVTVVLIGGAKAQPAGPPLQFGLSFSCDSRRLATCGDELRLFDVRTGERLKGLEAVPGPRMKNGGPLSRAIAFSPTDADLLAIGFDSGVIQLWRVGGDQPVRELKGHDGILLGLAFSPDGRSLASASTQYVAKLNKGQLKVWNVADGQLLRELGCEGQLQGVSFSRDGKRLAYCAGDRIEVMDVDTGQNYGRATLPHGDQNGAPFGMATRFARDDERIYVAGGVREPVGEGCRPTGLLWKVKLDDPSSVDLIGGPSEGRLLRSVAVTPDGTRVVTGYCQRSDGLAIQHITMFNATEGKSLWTSILEAGRGGIQEPFGIQISPDGKLIGWCNVDRIELTDVLSGRSVRTLKLLDP